MIKNIKLKNNNGISLASVLVTVIIMLIILTSIVYSNSRTNEIKKSMLINSDIEELTKKVEVYYLEKETLPMSVEPDSKFKYIEEGKTADTDTPVYYRLQISLLDNVTLNNKEKIQNESAPTNEDQWYVINKETHTIYFVKYEVDKIVPQTAQYSEKYDDITLGAINDPNNRIKYNWNTTDPDPTTGSTTLAAGTDNLIEDQSSINYGNLYGEPGTGTGPVDPTKDTGNYNRVFDYVGYSENWIPGNKATNLVLHYDGEMNTLKKNEKLVYHNNSTSTWSDLSGNNYDGQIVKGSTWNLKYDTNSKKVSESDSRTSSNISSEWKDGMALELKDSNYVLHDFVTTNNSNTTYNSNTISNGNSDFTIEMVINYNKERLDNIALYGNGIGLLKKYDNVYGTYYKDNKAYGINFSKNYSDTDSVDYKYNESDAKSHASDLADEFLSEKLTPWQNNYKNLFNTLISKTMKDPITATVTTDYEKEWGILTYWYYGKYTIKYSTNNEPICTSLYLGLNSSDNIIYWYDKLYGENSWYAKSINSIKSGKHTFTFAYDGKNQTVNCYVDGKILSTYNTNERDVVNLECAIGASGCELYHSYVENTVYTYYYRYTNFLNDKIYSVRIYNKALSNEEVLKNYNVDAERFGSGA